jgi:hypothetical protein
VNAIFTIYRDIKPEYKLITSTEHQELIMKNVTGVYTAPVSTGLAMVSGSFNVFLSDARRAAQPVPAAGLRGPVHLPGRWCETRRRRTPSSGFETVTIVYSGEVEHRDSTGKGGVIGPGDVQWMTAGAGILHEEFHSSGFAERRRTENDAAVGQPARERQNGGTGLSEHHRTRSRW